VLALQRMLGHAVIAAGPFAEINAPITPAMWLGKPIPILIMIQWWLCF